MKALIDQGQSGELALLAHFDPSFKEAPPTFNKKKVKGKIEKAISETITEYVRAGGVLQLPMTFKKVLVSRIMKMIEEHN